MMVVSFWANLLFILSSDKDKCKISVEEQLKLYLLREVFILKKYFVKLTTVIAICMCAILITNTCVEAKSIYFSGMYKCSKKGVPYKLELNMYSSPEGKMVGNYDFIPVNKEYVGWNGELKKVGKNKYQERFPGVGGFTLTFKVKKKSVIVKQKGTVLRGVDFSGKYKLKKRYPMP